MLQSTACAVLNPTVCKSRRISCRVLRECGCQNVNPYPSSRKIEDSPGSCAGPCPSDPGPCPCRWSLSLSRSTASLRLPVLALLLVAAAAAAAASHLRRGEARRSPRLVHGAASGASPWLPAAHHKQRRTLPQAPRTAARSSSSAMIQPLYASWPLTGHQTTFHGIKTEGWPGVVPASSPCPLEHDTEHRGPAKHLRCRLRSLSSLRWLRFSLRSFLSLPTVFAIRLRRPRDDPSPRAASPAWHTMQHEQPVSGHDAVMVGS